MLVATLVAALVGSLALLALGHGSPENATALGGAARLLEAAATVAVAAIALTLVRRLRRRPTSSKPLRLGFFVATLTWLSSGLYPTLESGGPFAYSVVLGLGAWAALVGAGPHLASRLPAKLIGAIDVVLINACLLVIGGELGLHGLALVTRSPLLAERGADSASYLKRHRYAPGAVRMGFPCNAQGHYDETFAPPSPGRCRVASIGDSFSSGVVPHHWHFTTVAERTLGDCAIDNLGAPAIGPEEYRLLVDEARPLAPDVVVVNLFVGNDILDLLGRDSSRRGWRRWIGRDNLLIFVVPRRLSLLARERRALGPQPIGGVGSESTAGRRLDVTEARREFPWLDDPALEKPTFSASAFDEIEAARAHSVLAPSGVADQSYPRLFELLTSMRAAVAPSRLLVMLIPDEVQVNDELWRRIQARVGQPMERDRPQRLVKEWLASQQIPVLDLLPTLRAAAPLGDGKTHLYHLQDTHFNARGNQVVGEALAEFLRPHLHR